MGARYRWREGRRDQSWLARRWGSAGVLLLALAAAGCGAPTRTTVGVFLAPAGSATPGQDATSDHWVPPIVLRDPPPGELDVQLSVQIDGTKPGTPAMEGINLAFMSHGNLVQFAGSERVTCDGKDLPIHQPSPSGQVVFAPAAQVAGMTISCEYVAGGASSRFTLRAPQAPTITSPAEGAQVPRGKATIVTYQSDPAAGSVMGVVALAPGSVSPKTVATINRPGSGQATLDTSGFAAVPGSLHLSVDLEPAVTTTGVPFKMIRASGIANISENVTWS